MEQLSKLNTQVDVQVMSAFSSEEIIAHGYDGVIITEAYGLDWTEAGASATNIYQLNYELRHKKIALIVTECLGMYGYVFNDFGEEYKIHSTGIEEKQLNIKEISFQEECLVTTFGKCDDIFIRDDIVEFLNIEGSQGLHMLNEKEYQITEIVDRNQNRINCDTSKFCDMHSGAKLSLKKRGETLDFFPMKESLTSIKLSMMCGLKKHLFFAKLLLEFRKTHTTHQITENDEEELIKLSESPEIKSLFEGEECD